MSGHAAVAPPMTDMNSHRLMSFSSPQRPERTISIEAVVHHGKSGRSMSALGQKRTILAGLRDVRSPPIADIECAGARK